MPLIDLKTDLKSLKYGRDQFNGGSSGQPYITTTPDGKTSVSVGTNSILGLLGVDQIPLIPNVSSRLNETRAGRFVNQVLGTDDFIRGGAAGSVQAAINDTFRIGAFLTDLPKGPLFIAKQVGLQLSNPKLEVKKGGRALVSGGLNLSPSSALGTLTGGILGPTRVYNLGINTLAQVPANAFGVHFSRHGLLPILDKDSKYESVVTFNNESNKSKENRLVELTDKFNLGKATSFSQQQSTFIAGINAAVRALTGLGVSVNPSKLNPSNNTIQGPYIGGPSSVYGIGATIINRNTYTGDTFKNLNIYRSNEAALKLSQSNINYYNTLGISKQIFSTNQEIKDSNNIDSARPTAKPEQIVGYTYQNTPNTDGKPIEIVGQGLIGVNTLTKKNKAGITPKYDTYKKLLASKILTDNQYYDSSITPANPQLSLAYLNTFNFFQRDATTDELTSPSQPVYKTDDPKSPYLGYRNGYGDIVKLRARNGWFSLSREERVGSGRRDIINLTPIFSRGAGTIDDKVIINRIKYNINDLVKFRIQALDGDDPSTANWMIFRAYLTQFSDNVDATWNSVKYAGRGEDFYIYGGFGRKIQINFKVAALSEEEMQPMYSKLNYLMGNLMPDYTKSGLMRGPIIRMTVGNWIDGQAGILNSLSYNVPQDSPWEIALTGENLILPHVVEVNMTFTPIGSQTKSENKISAKSNTTSHIAQNINDKPQFVGGGIQYATGSGDYVTDPKTKNKIFLFNDPLAVPI
jgi:hypothetical protein